MDRLLKESLRFSQHWRFKIGDLRLEIGDFDGDTDGQFA